MLRLPLKDFPTSLFQKAMKTGKILAMESVEQYLDEALPRFEEGNGEWLSINPFSSKFRRVTAVIYATEEPLIYNVERFQNICAFFLYVFVIV